MDDRKKLLNLGEMMIDRYADEIQIPFMDVRKRATEELKKRVGAMTEAETEEVVDKIKEIINR